MPRATRVTPRTRGDWRSGPARQELIREHNLALVLARILEPATPVTRAQIAQTTGLTRATVSDLVESLVSAGLVTELAPKAGTRAGRPGVPLAPAPRTIVGIGLDVAVDHLGVTVVDLSGRTVSQRVVEGDLRDSNPARTLTRLAGMVSSMAEEVTDAGMRPAGVALVVPGLTDASGTVRFAPNLGWHDVPALTRVREESGLTGIPWTVGNDADLAARAECQARARATEGPVADQDFVYVAGHFGLGGAVIRHGVLAAGLHGWGGEIGHAPMDPLGPDCTCGANGCVEQYAGRHIVMRRAGLEPTARTDVLLDLLDPGDGPDGADSARIEQAGKAVQVAAGAVGRAAAMAANIVDLDVIVLGGLYADLFDHVAPTVREEVGRRVLSAQWVPLTVERALVRELASLRGAALSVLETVAAEPSLWTGRNVTVP